MQISAAILTKPHHRENARELYAYAAKLENGKAKAAKARVEKRAAASSNDPTHCGAQLETE